MKKFNLNDYIFVQITKYGWEKLRENETEEYIQHCILSNQVIISGEIWYKLQGHQLFGLFGNMLFTASHHPIEMNILLEE